MTRILQRRYKHWSTNSNSFEVAVIKLAFLMYMQFFLDVRLNKNIKMLHKHHTAIKYFTYSLTFNIFISLKKIISNFDFFYYLFPFFSLTKPKYTGKKSYPRIKNYDSIVPKFLCHYTYKPIPKGQSLLLDDF